MANNNANKQVENASNDHSVLNDLKNDFSEQVGTELRKASKKTPLKTKLIILLIFILVIGAVLFFAGDAIFTNKGGKTYTVSESTLTDVIETSNLSTLEFTYNAIVSVPSEENPETILYYIAYEGIVKAGIDIKDITISIVENKIEILLPEATIQETNVDAGTMEYIFSNSKYDTQDVPSKAYSICKKDLEERAKEEDELLKVAKENAVSAISALIEPWINEVSEDYTLEVK